MVKEIVILIFVITIIVFGYFYSKKPKYNLTNNTVLWSFDGQKWQASGTPPKCPDQLIFDLPIDVSFATGILYPGQVRGNDYKPHGGFRFDNLLDNKVEVRAIMDGYILKAAKYKHEGYVQNFFFYVNNCGIMVMHDHLLTLSPKLQEIFDKIPLGVDGDSRTTNITPQVFIKKGELLATEVGYPSFPGGSNGKNVFLDFGLYDLRKTNKVSYSESLISKNPSINEYGKYAVCFFDHLAESDKKTVKGLPAGGIEGKVSDYCK